MTAAHEIDLTPRPAVVEAVAVPPPGDWVARVTELAAAEGMAPLRVAPGDAWQSGGRWVLHPWWLLHDATALLMWAQHLDDDVEVQVWRIPGQQGGLVVHGALAGYPTALIGHSWRLDLDTAVRAPYALPVSELADLASHEARSADTAPRPRQGLPSIGRLEWRPGPDAPWQPAELCMVVGERGRSLCMLVIRLDADGRTELVAEHTTRPVPSTPIAVDEPAAAPPAPAPPAPAPPGAPAPVASTSPAPSGPPWAAP